MTIREYLNSKKAKGIDLAKALGVPPTLIYQWANGVRPVPVARCIPIEQATHGDVRCEEMRPDHPWHVLRGTAN